MPLQDNPATQQAAKLLTKSDAFKAGPIAWLSFFDIIASGIRVLVEGCAPRPQDAVAYINWKPLFPRLMGWRLTEHRRSLKVAFAKQARAQGLSPYDANEAAKNFIKAVEEGAITVELMKGLYEENKVI